SKYFFGTSIRNEKDSQEADEYLGMVPESTKRFPPSPNKAIASMNRFFEGFTGKPYRNFQMDYAILCYYVHHSIVGSRSFIDIQAQLENGFLQTYSHNENITGDHVKLILRIILPNTTSLVLRYTFLQTRKSYFITMQIEAVLLLMTMHVVPKASPATLP